MIDTAQHGEAPPAQCYIVEDNPAVARFIARALTDFGVTSAQFTGVSALTAGLAAHLP